MRDIVVMAMTTRRPAAICFVLTGTASSRTVHAADVITSRAQRILVASRTQNILA